MSESGMSEKAILSCRNLGKSYEEGPESVVVLSNLQLELHPGERVAIVGAMQVLDRQVLKWEPGSKEAKYILKARKALTRVAGKQEEDAEQLSPALLKLYLSELLGPQNPPQPPQGAAPQSQPGMGAAPLGPGAPMGGMAPQ